MGRARALAFAVPPSGSASRREAALPAGRPLLQSGAPRKALGLLLRPEPAAL